MASITSGRLPSLKFGTHSTIRFISSPDEFSALEGRSTEVYSGEIGNLTVIRDVVHGEICLFARFDRTEIVFASDRARAVDRRGDDGFRRSHFHLRAGQ